MARTMTVAALTLVFCCCLWCDGQVVDGGGDEARLRFGFNGWHGACSLDSMSQKLGAMGEKVANMAEKMTLLEARLQNAEKDVLELRSLTGGEPRVAFSVALRDSGAGDVGPFDIDTPLQYKRIFSNIGSSYNPSTGIFTATVKGVYYFRFTMYNNRTPVSNSVVSLTKNGALLTSVWDVSGPDANDSGSNAVVIPLEVGDAVYVQLASRRVVYDDFLNYNTFSGFLLFTT